MRRKVNLERDKNTDVVLSSALLATEGNFKSGTARQSSKFKIVLRLSALQCGKFMGAAIANSRARFRRLALKMQIGAGKLNLRRLKRSASWL